MTTEATITYDPANGWVWFFTAPDGTFHHGNGYLTKWGARRAAKQQIQQVHNMDKIRKETR